MKNNVHFTAIVTMVILTLIFIAAVIFVTNCNIINFICVAIMVGILCYVYRTCLLRGKKISSDFSQAKSIIEALKISKEDEIVFIGNNENLFKDREISQIYKKYREDLLRNYDGDKVNVIPDIHIYFNENMIDRAINTEISDQVSGAMTGLGILGTFVGLTVGLQHFDLGVDIDTIQMQNSISGLLDGIKTAFMTSIFGVIYSLVYGFFYKKIYQDAIDNMNGFLAEFDEKISPNSENDMLTAFARNQKIQTDNIANFADNIALSMSKYMDEIIRPTMDCFNKSIDTFIEKSVYTHNESLDTIVNAFVDNMNASLGNRFTELGSTLNRFSEGQVESIEKLDSIVKEVCRTGTDIVQINVALEKNIDTMVDYFGKLDLYQSRINESNEQLLERIDVINGYNDNQVEILTCIEETQRGLTKTVDRLCAEVERLGNIEDTFSEKVDKSSDKVCEVIADQADEYRRSIAEILESANDKITESAKKSEEIISSVFEKVKIIIDEFEVCADEHSKSIAEAASAAAQASRSTVEGCRENIKYQTDLTEKLINEMIGAVTDAVGAINAADEEQSKKTAEVFREAMEASREALEIQIRKSEELSRQLEDCVTRSAEKLNTEYKKLEGNITDVLKNTFNSFDNELSDISSYLSSTINRSNETIIDLNKYMEEIPLRLYEIIEEMLRDMTDYIKNHEDKLTVTED